MSKFENFLKSFFVKLGLKTSIALGLLFAWFVFSILYLGGLKSLVKDQNQHIADLQKTNKIFSQEIDFLNENLKKINDYFIQKADMNNILHEKMSFSDFKRNNLIYSSKLAKFSSLKAVDDKDVILKLVESNVNLVEIKSMIANLIGAYEDKIVALGINVKDKDNIANAIRASNERQIINISLDDELALRQGGPVDEIDEGIPGIFDFAENVSLQQYLNLDNKIDYLIGLQDALQKMPVVAPMENYYVSSNYGRRADPIRGRYSYHRGIDLAGSYNEPILATADGKVKYAGWMGAYGKVVVIEHDFGIVTKYGHLKRIHTKKGQMVTRGDKIGIQGNTGRSNGPHLHYEVRYNKRALDPKKFINLGDELAI